MTRSNVPAPETAPHVPPSGLAASAAELPADVLAAIEREMRTRVSDVPPELVAHAVAASKKRQRRVRGQTLRRRRAVLHAGDRGAPDDNAAVPLRGGPLGRTEEAVADGVRCVALDARWPKAHYRLGKALAAAGEWHAAASSLETCARLMTGVGLDEKKHDDVPRDVSASSEEPSTKEDTNRAVAEAEDAGKVAAGAGRRHLDGVLELLAVAQARAKTRACGWWRMSSKRSRSRQGCVCLQRTTEKPRPCDTSAESGSRGVEDQEGVRRWRNARLRLEPRRVRPRPEARRMLKHRPRGARRAKTLARGAGRRRAHARARARAAKRLGRAKKAKRGDLQSENATWR